MRTRLAAVSALAMGLLFAMSSLAFASTAPPTPREEVATAVSSGVDTAKGIITDNLALVLGVAVAWIALRFGKRIIRSVG